MCFRLEREKKKEAAPTAYGAVFFCSHRGERRRRGRGRGEREERKKEAESRDGFFSPSPLSHHFLLFPLFHSLALSETSKPVSQDAEVRSFVYARRCGVLYFFTSFFVSPSLSLGTLVPFCSFFTLLLFSPVPTFSAEKKKRKRKKERTNFPTCPLSSVLRRACPHGIPPWRFGRLEWRRGGEF